MRGLLRVIALLLGIGVTVVGVLVVIEVAASWARPDADGGLLVPWPDWGAALAGVSWDQDPVPAVAIGVGVVGLLLVLVALCARRVSIHLDGPAGPAGPPTDMTVTTSPRTLARLVGTRVRADDDVRTASVTASARRVAVTATVAADAPREIRETLAGRAGELLTELPLRRRPRVAVSVHEQEGPA